MAQINNNGRKFIWSYQNDISKLLLNVSIENEQLQIPGHSE